MEPRTASGQKRLQTVKKLSAAGIPVRVMLSPVIPGLNDNEIPAIINAAREAGARDIIYTVVRLNGTIGPVFLDWINKNFPDKYHKVKSQIETLHEGHLNDSTYHRRMKGEGPFAKMINTLFKVNKRKHFHDVAMPDFNLTAFRKGGNYTLF